MLQERADRRVVRVGSTVRHPLQPWTPAVHALLDRLEAVGFPYSPRVLGVDGTVEILSYIDGESGPDGWAKVVDEAGLQATAGLLRAYHDAIEGRITIVPTLRQNAVALDRCRRSASHPPATDPGPGRRRRVRALQRPAGAAIWRRFGLAARARRPGFAIVHQCSGRRPRRGAARDRVPCWSGRAGPAGR